jgi:hypothetical protein
MGMALTAEDFIARWKGSSGSERAHFQSFANDLCILLGVDRPSTTDHGALSAYEFEHPVCFPSQLSDFPHEVVK